MSIITTGDIPSLLRPGLYEVKAQYERYKAEYQKVFEQSNSEKFSERLVDIRGTGYALEKTQGEPIKMDSMGERFTYEFVHREFALGFQITNIAMEDDLYADQFFNGTKSLTTSYEQTREVVAMNVFNQAFNPAVTIADGQTLCSVSHPYDGGTYSNKVGAANVNVDFSEAGVEQAIILAGKMRDQAGLLINAKIERLLLPQDLMFSGCRLLESVFRTGTANNDINAIYSMKAIPQGYDVNHFLTSPSNWFALTNVKGTRRHFIRKPLKINMSTDPLTETMSIMCSGRYSFGVFTPNGLIGATGSAA
jgi:hypothetical protein